MKVRSVSCRLVAVAIGLSLGCCGFSKGWRKVGSFKGVAAGTLLQLEPLDSGSLKVQLSQRNKLEFRFRCTAGSAKAPIEFQPFVGVVTDGFSMETKSSRIETWNPPASDVVFEYYLIPPQPIGKVLMYFYLADKEGKAISSIIERQVVFAE